MAKVGSRAIRAGRVGRGHAAVPRYHAPYTKGNFQFERIITGWRTRYPLLYLRLRKKYVYGR
jgi:hypothetical protein